MENSISLYSRQQTTIKPFTHDGNIKPDFPTELTEEEFRNINRFTLEIRERNEAEAEQREEVNHIENFFSSVLDEMLVSGNKTDEEKTSPKETDKDENNTSSEMEDIDEDEEYY